MKLQLWRNATLQLKTHSTTFLIDPMLGKKGSFGVFPWTNDERKNPLVGLPFSDSELEEKLAITDAVFVSHLHPDHWDEAAIRLIDKKSAIICPEAIAKEISSFGFQNVTPIHTEMSFNKIKLYLTNGQHGRGEIGEKMGLVNGLVFQQQNSSVYVAGDTIWCQDVKTAIDTHKPDHIIVAGGAATFAVGEPVTMTAEHIKELSAYSPKSSIWITHLEAVSPCRESRAFLTDFIQSNDLEDQCKILDDGETVELTQ